MRGESSRRGSKVIGMVRKASVVIEKDAHGFYAWCPELKGCHSQGSTLEEAIANIKEAIELYLETPPESERHGSDTLHPKIVKQALEAIAEAPQESEE
jgi:predicted RNase H-like HicB family nuclease